MKFSKVFVALIAGAGEADGVRTAERGAGAAGWASRGAVVVALRR